MEGKYPKGFRPLLIPVRFTDQEDGLRALNTGDYSKALRPNDSGFEDAPFEIGLLNNDWEDSE